MLPLDLIQHFFLGVYESFGIPVPFPVSQPKGGDQSEGTKQNPAQELTTPSVPFASGNGACKDTAQDPNNNDHWSLFSTSSIRF